MGMGIKILDGEPFHFFKQVVAHIALGPLGYIDHQPGLGKGCHDSQRIKDDHTANGSRQRSEIRVLLPQHGNDVIIDQGFDKQGPLKSCKHTGKNTDHNNNPLNRIILEGITQHPL